jgi:ribosomal protein S26
MARKSLGYTELEWTCPNCMTKNKGTQKTCTGCGSPQPESIQFQQGKTQQFIEDEQLIQAAKAGADFHCSFCGARNAATNEVCVQCGADLKGSAQRQTGQVIGAFKEGEAQKIQCPNCGELNSEDQAVCANCGGSLVPESPPPPTPPEKARSQGATSAGSKPKTKSKTPFIIGGIALILLCLCIVLIFALTSQQDSLTGTVQNVAWTRSVAIEQYGVVTREDWLDEIPSDATLGSCDLQYHHTQNSPTANSEEICGTPYTVDSGTGVGEVVQDCEYRVYLEYCEYQIYDWQTYDNIAIQGNDLNPAWPDAQLSDVQRFGEQEENYAVYFATDDGVVEYNPATESQFLRCRPGSEWLLSTNAFGKVIDIEPAGN